MSQRKSTLISEEGTTPGSPLRRSTRIANSPAPAPVSATGGPATLSRRRSSATESSVSTPAKLGTKKRPSLSCEVLLEDEPETPKRIAKGSGAASKSPSVEREAKAVTAGTPSKRGRRSSVTKIIEEEIKVTTTSESPSSRRRSARGQSTSPTRESSFESQAAKPRGRRASVSQASLEIIAETETKPEARKIGRPTNASRRASLDASEETEVKKEEKKQPTRRSIRGRSNSVDISEEESKPLRELNPINEEENEVFEVKLTDNAEDVLKATIEIKNGKNVEKSALDEIKEADTEVENALKPKERSLSPKTVMQELRDESIAPDEVFKSPVRRSPRLSSSPVYSTSPKRKDSPLRTPPRISKQHDVEDKGEEVNDEGKQKDESSPVSIHLSTGPLSTEENNAKKNTSPKKSPKIVIEKSESLQVPTIATAEGNPNPTAEKPAEILTEKARRSRSPLPAGENNSSVASAEENTLSDKPAEILTVKSTSSPVTEDNNLSSTTVSPVKFVALESNVPASPRRKSLRLSESEGNKQTKRKSSSLSESDSKEVPKSPFGEKNILTDSQLNVSHLNQKTSKKDLVPSDSGKTFGSDSPSSSNLSLSLDLLPSEVDKTFGSDSPSNLSLPLDLLLSTDIENKSKSKVDAVLDCSGSSNNSDKENADKSNLIQSPGNKKLPVNETSTPKLICEPMEIEHSEEVVFAIVSTEVKNKRETTLMEKSLNESNIIEVDNADEFGSSPIKKVKQTTNKAIQSEEELEDELMQSFVDEVIDDSPSEIDVETVSEPIDLSEDSKIKEDVKLVSDKQVVKINEQEIDSEDVFVVKVSPEREVEQSASVNKEKTIIASDESNENVTDSYNRSKRRKLHTSESLSNIYETSFKDLIAKKLEDMESSDEDDDDYKPDNEYIDDMAMEGEEDTPSEGSNDIIDVGESLHSSESNFFSDSDDVYENDSFIADDESIELLPGSEFDINDEFIDVRSNKKQKKKSRIIAVSSSSEDEVEEIKSAVPNGDVVEVEDVKSPQSNKVVILQDIKITADPVINEEDNLASLETMKEATDIEIPNEPKPSLSTPNNSILESPDVSRKTRKKTSITIQEQMKIGQIDEGAITKKISKAVDFLVSSITEKSGNVSLNVSLDYANSSMSSEDGRKVKSSSPIKSKASPKQFAEVEEILETPVNEEERETKEKQIKKKKRRSNMSLNQGQTLKFDFNDSLDIEKENQQNVSMQDGFEVHVIDEVVPVEAKKNKRLSKKRESQEQAKKTLDDSIISIKDDFEDVPTGKPKRRSSQGDESIIKALSPKKKRKLDQNLREYVSPVETNALKASSLESKKQESPNIQAEKVKKRRSLENMPSTSFHVETTLDADEEVSFYPNNQEKKRKMKKQINSVPDEGGDKSDAFEPVKHEKKSKKKQKLSVDNEEHNVELAIKKKPKKGNKLEYFPVDMLVEEENDAQEHNVELKTKKKTKKGNKLESPAVDMLVKEEKNAQVTKYECTRPNIKVPSHKKSKTLRPTSVKGDYGNEWDVQGTEGVKPSRMNNNKVAVRAQVEKLKQKLAPNDFKNQMIYDSSVKRMDSKEIFKNKQKASYRISAKK